MRKADDLIQRFLDSIGQREGAAYVGLFRSWQSIVGERIAAHAQPVDVRGQSLVVEADHPGWVQMVMMKRARIIAEVNRRFPELTITGLTLRVVDLPGAARPGKDRPERSGTTSTRTTDSPGAGSGRPAPSSGPHADPAETNSPEQPPQPPSRDENEALDRIEDEDLRTMLSRLRNDLEDNSENTSE